MENWEPLIKKIIELMGFGDYRVEVKPDQRRSSVYIYDSEPLIKENLPTIVESMSHFLQMVARKNEWPPVILDVNNYRQERERLITELARAAAKKASQTKQEVYLPSMNSYERRIVHVELAVHPEVKTESVGEARERHVVVKPISS